MGCRRVGTAVALLGLAGTVSVQTGAPASSASFPPPAASAAPARPTATGSSSAAPPAPAPAPSAAAPAASAPAPAGAPATAPGYAPYPYPPPYGYPPYGYPPPYYYPYPPPGYYDDAPKDTRPRTLPFEGGKPPPPGYHVESGVRRGPVIAGALMFGISYGLQLLVASADDFSDSSEWLVVPVLGSWVFMSEECDRGNDDGCTFLALHGVTQTVGAVLLVYGLASKNRRFVRDEVGVQLAPARLGSGYGFSARGRF